VRIYILKMSNENNCPSCGTPDAYIGIMFVECANSNCDLYTENQAHIVRQQKIAEIKIREQQGEKEDLREEKRKLAKDFLDTFVETSRSNNTATVPAYPLPHNRYTGYSDKSKKVDDKRDTLPAPAGPPVSNDIEEEEPLTPWNYHLYEEEDYDD